MTANLIVLVLALVWVLGALLAIKLDAVLCPQASDYADKILASIFIWPIIAVLLLTVKHRASNVTDKSAY